MTLNLRAKNKFTQVWQNYVFDVKLAQSKQSFLPLSELTGGSAFWQFGGGVNEIKNEH